MSKIRVLIADDNNEVLQYVHEFLSTNGCQVIGTATNGQTAVEAAARLLPDVVVLDVSMPVLSGIEAAARMLQANPSLKIVFLTVMNDPDVVHAALNTGACGYVLKTRLVSELDNAIKLAKEGRRFVSAGCD